MQLKFNRQQGLKQSFAKRLVKIFLILLLLVFIVFVLEKFNFPYPNSNLKIDITDEIIKLK
jgi:flagellar biogenesis protein FliO|tara:strand:- start:610 stop:792 length:183 start_codon:yes stop_codon:yes gene_type:complete